jgi:hypothetical protein
MNGGADVRRCRSLLRLPYCIRQILALALVFGHKLSMRVILCHRKSFPNFYDDDDKETGTSFKKFAVTQLDKKLPTFYGIRRSITTFTRAPPLILILRHFNPVHTWRDVSLRLIQTLLFTTRPS